MRSLASELALTEERERGRIAHELHDNISQSLALSMIKLDFLRGSTMFIDDNINLELDQIGGLVKNTIEDVQSLTFSLSFITMLQRFGFVRALCRSCKKPTRIIL